ncbi:MAG: hemolysin family protein [Pseudomonadota bacterium]
MGASLPGTSTADTSHGDRQGGEEPSPTRPAAAASSPVSRDLEDAPTQINGHDTATTPGDASEDGFLGRLMRRASEALGAGPSEEEGEGEEALGPAFSGSTDAELRLVRNILRLRDLRVNNVMTPRADIVAVAEDADLASVMAAFAEDSLSRLPVFRETLDDPLGFVHLKDLALTYGVGCSAQSDAFSLTPHLRTALFVPPSMRIAALLQKMQGSRVHMALVIDEFGGVDGLVTIEDLVEQIVGDIEDEHDEDEGQLWREEAPGSWLINARADIAEFEEASGITLRPAEWDEDADTLGGLVFMLTGRVPVRAEVIRHPAGHEFQIVEADARRIKRLRLSLAGGSAMAASEARPQA